MRLLLVTNDTDVRHRIAAVFDPAGAVVDHAQDAGEALVLERLYHHDLIILGSLRSDGTALTALRGLRAAGLATPAVWISGASDVADRVRALNLGADDCLDLRVDPSELLARARRAVRRADGHAKAAISIGDLVIDTAARTVVFAGRRLRITGKEFEILELLALRNGAVVSRGTIMDHLYGGPDEPLAKIIDIHVCRIRRKLAEASDQTPLRTVWGQGFSLSAPTPMAA